mmetsp:Transcript_2253/g.3110  ORF Transcript_2253/g.3110 Transcript_2253/m.3110 type:complete len:206 (-) Transcript_2253:1020-1637(-)
MGDVFAINGLGLSDRGSSDSYGCGGACTGTGGGGALEEDWLEPRRRDCCEGLASTGLTAGGAITRPAAAICSAVICLGSNSISLGMSAVRTPSTLAITLVFSLLNLLKFISLNFSLNISISGKSPGARLYVFITVRNTDGRSSIIFFCFFSRLIIGIWLFKYPMMYAWTLANRVLLTNSLIFLSAEFRGSMRRSCIKSRSSISNN